MVMYNISYGEPEPRSFWRSLLIILLILLALAIIAGAAYAVYTLVMNQDGPDRAAAESTPIAEAVVSLYDDDTNTIFLVDNSKTISRSVPAVKEALLGVVLPYTDPNAGRPAKNSLASLVLFTDVPEPFPELASLESLETSTKWLHAVDTLKTIDRPAFIYDAVGAAHNALLHHGDGERDNAIVLLTDGGDGGFGIVDPAKAEICGAGIDHAPGEVCNPVFETIPVDLDELVPCPPNMAIVPGEVCDPVSIASVGETVIAYHPVNPDEMKPCTPELGGATSACVDIITGYQPFHPEKVEPCPEALDEPGKACVEFKSNLTQDELLAILTRSDVHSLKVHTIGLGNEADHNVLKLLAAATGGKYIYADSSGVAAMNRSDLFAGSR